ncbi:hypothetical protein [Lysobacter xanthus]
MDVLAALQARPHAAPAGVLQALQMQRRHACDDCCAFGPDADDEAPATPVDQEFEEFFFE